LVYYANAIDNNCYYELILGILIYMQRETIHAEIIDKEAWAEVDDPNDLNVAEFVFHSDRKQILDRSFGGFWNYDLLDFCFIRNMYFPNASIISEMRNDLPQLIHNYGSRQEVLDRKMAWFLLCREKNVVALNGASQVYPMLAEVFAGKRALIPEPTFGEYPRIFPRARTYADHVGIDLATIAAENCDVVVFVNPNNPSGTVLETAWIYQYAVAHPATTVIVDESFIEFSGQPSIASALEERPLPNVLVVKSLSKSLGVPGIRLGYAYSCNAELTRSIRARLPIWNLNSIAENFLEIILKHRPALQRSFEDTVRDRELFLSQMTALPIVDRVYPSGGNFLLVKLRQGGPSAAALSAALLEHHAIFVKDISQKFGDGGSYLRVAVRLPEENALFARSCESCAG
jgi:histidinol-phosphate/aromatic aminotransferase/cobyric acid decarboxylase-like protein